VREHLQYVRPVSRIWCLIRRYGVDLLIVVSALAAALEVALRDDATKAPRSTPWFAAPAAALVVCRCSAGAGGALQRPRRCGCWRRRSRSSTGG
jgi:hypothetical protein